MAIFQERLQEALNMRNMAPADLSKATKIGEGAISQYRKGAYKASQRNLEKISKALNVSIPWLMGVSDDHSIPSLPPNILPPPKTYLVPRLGTIACGEPILAAENIEGYDSIPEDIRCDFTLICKGDSMINARIFDGDIVCIKQTDIVNSGEIAAALVDADEATLKRVRLFDDHIVLEPENPMYKPLVFWHEDMNRVRILGKATHFISVIH